ncbi:DUF6756 family protein [Spongorhabdus nitratireducens]
MSQVLKEVEKAISKLGLSNSVSLLVDEDGFLYKELISHFVEGGDRRWWWEAFLQPSESLNSSDPKGFERLPELVPDPKEIVWFVVEDHHLAYYPIFEASTEAAVQVIGECFAFEYYLVPKDKSWLLCETHHNQIIGVGKQVVAEIELRNN